MKQSRKSDESFEELDKAARNTRDIRPLSPTMLREWRAAVRTGGGKRRSGRPRKDPRLKSRIVPISIDPKLLTQVDKFAKTAGISRSRLVAEGLRLRMKD